MSATNLKSDLYSDVEQLDRAQQYVELFRYLTGAKAPPEELVYALYRLMADGRFQSAFITAKLLAGQSIDNALVDFGRAVGGVIFANPGEESEGRDRLVASLGRLSPADLEKFRQGVGLPVFRHAVAVEHVAGNAELKARLARIEAIVFTTQAPSRTAAAGRRAPRAANDLWAPLIEELDRWTSAGMEATFWWRDDDAQRHTPHLEKLLSVAGDHPVSLAVIPGGMEPSLVAALAGKDRITVLQHGWTHDDHTDKSGPSEYPDGRDLGAVRVEIQSGRAMLVQQFGARALPVFVPPWGGLDQRYLPILIECGIAFVSGSPLWDGSESGVRDVRVHVDMIDWDLRARFGEPSEKVSLIRNHLQARRMGWVRPTEATGILTHHQQQTEASYRFIADLLRITDAHPAARWLHGGELFSREVARAKPAPQAKAGAAPAPELAAADAGANIQHLDRQQDYVGIVRYLKEKKYDVRDALFALYRLMIDGRFQSAFLVAKFLSGSSVDNPTVELARGVGGAIFGNPVEEEQGAAQLARALVRLSPKQLSEFRSAVAAPVFGHAFHPEILGSNRKLEKRLMRIRDLVAAPDAAANPASAVTEPALHSLIDRPYFLSDFIGVLKGRYLRMGEGCILFDIDRRRAVTHMQQEDWIFGQYVKEVEKVDLDLFHRNVVGAAGKEIKHQPLLITAYPKNYFHTTFECMAALRMLGREHRRVAIGPELQQFPWQRELLAHCLGDRQVIALDGTEILVDPIVFFSYASTESVDFVRNRMNVFAKPGDQIVLVERSGPTTRNNGNTAIFAESPAWKRTITRIGARRTNFGAGELTVTEQVKRLDGVRTIIASHGAGLTNLIYLKPPINVIEITDPHMAKRDILERIAKHLGFNYHRMICADFTDDWRMKVDTKELGRLIRDDARPAARPAAHPTARPRKRPARSKRT